MDRVVIFANNQTPEATILLRGTLEALKSSDNLRLLAVCVPTPQKFGAEGYQYLRRRTAQCLRSMFGPHQRHRHKIPLPVDLRRWSRRMGFKILVPPGSNANDAAFIERLRNEFQPTFALSYYWLQKFSTDLLACFHRAVNYHNALLPNYKGRHATAWSVYNGEQETGFTFHYMNAQLDEGPIVLQQALPILPDDSVFDLEIEKAQRAAERIPDVLKSVLAGEPGRPQTGPGSYYSNQDFQAIRTISDPAALPSTELVRRLRAFESLKMRLAGQWYSVTKIEQAFQSPANPDGLCFRASDGVVIRPTRFRYLPFGAYRALEWARNHLRRPNRSSDSRTRSG